jgi:predicted transposase/invertase (TIGR01784 family)
MICKSKQKELSQPHARAFNFFFRERETACSMLQEYLPGKILRKLDLNSLKISEKSFIDKRMKDYFADLLYEVKLKSSPRSAFVYMLFEHKCWEDWFVSLQLLKYMVRIWELFLKQNKEAKYLPIIVPLVIYHGKPKWKLGENFISLFGDPGDFQPYIPDFRFNLYDISHMPDEDIRGTALLKIILTSFKYIYSPYLRNKLWDIFKLFLTLNDKNTVFEYLEALLNYLVNSPGELTEEDLQEPVARIIEEGGDIMQTIAEKWIERGVERGVEKGVRIGVEKGAKEKDEEIVMNMIRYGMNLNDVAKITGHPIEKIRQMKSRMRMH